MACRYALKHDLCQVIQSQHNEREQCKHSNGMQGVASLGRPKPERFTRKEQAKQAALRAQQAEGDASQDGQPGAESDANGTAQTEAAAEAAEEVCYCLCCSAKHILVVWLPDIL